MSRVALALLAGALAGCVVRVKLDARPAGAVVQLPNGTEVTTPTVAKVRWLPIVPQKMVVRAPGYRDLHVGLKSNAVSTRRVLGGLLHPLAWTRDDPRYQLEFVLVPEHGPAGTWTPESEGLAP